MRKSERGSREFKEAPTACCIIELKTSTPAAAVRAPPLVKMDVKPREVRMASCPAISSIRQD